MGWVYNASPEVEAASQYPVILGVCISLTILMIITVCLRLYVRAQASRLGSADYVMVVSMLNYAGRPFYQLGIAGFKASLCLSYLRLISGTSMHMYRILIWAVIVRRAWDFSVLGHCLPVGPTFYGLAIFTIVCDVVIIFLPIPLLLRLNIKPAQKAGVVCLFLLGLFTTICSVLRLTQIHRVAFGDGNSTMLVLWGTIEFNIGNIVTCVPYLAPLLRGFVRDFRTTSGRKYYDTQGRSYAMENWSKDPRSHLQSNASGPPVPRRSPSEELILSSREPSHGGIEMTVEYSVSLENEPEKTPRTR
ncbi:hypothetical protein PoHVEF18_006277 [Penicillium ochrochloron]